MKRIKNKSSFKLKLRNISLIALAYVIVFASIAGAVEAQVPVGGDSVEISKIQESLKEEAEAQLVIKTLATCIKGSYDERSTDLNPAKDIDSEEFFDYGNIGGVVTVATGYWLEDQVQSNGGDDGAIYCRQGNSKILKLGAKYLGFSSVNDIICGENGTDGILYNKDGKNCNPTADDDNYRFSKNWSAHLESLYNAQKAKKGWTTSYSNLGTYGGVNGYFLYSVEATYRCGGLISGIPL